MQSKAPGRSSHASLERGLLLFDLIIKDRGGTSLLDLARPLAISRATIYRLAASLEQNGMIVPLGRGRYSAGLKLLHQLGDISARAQLVQITRPILQKLAQSCRATAHLGVLENDMVTYLVKVSPGQPTHEAMFTQENAQLEAYCSGIGKMLLAWLPPDQLHAYLAAGPFVALTANTMTDPSALRDHLREVRAQGFARDHEEIETGLQCLAVPVPADDAPPRMAISLSFQGASVTDESVMAHLALLRGCAEKFSKYVLF